MSLLEQVCAPSSQILWCSTSKGVGALQVKSILSFLFDVLELPLHILDIKVDQGIQILQLKKDQKFLLFSLLFSKCFYQYLRKPAAAPFWCVASHM